MAKDRDPGAMSEESIAFLEEVKKGKPRRFAMICKGPTVVSLVVYKKGSIEKRKKEAKESGKGQFYFGVVDGKGVNIRFVLARADGFEDAPVKTSVLKAFLGEEADFTCKPFFEIVDAAPIALDEDDPLVARYMKLKDAAEQVMLAAPERAAEIKALSEAIARNLDQEQSQEAATGLDQLEAMLNQIGVPDAPPAPPPPPPPPPTQDSGAASIFKQRMRELKPQLDQVLAGQTTVSVEAKRLVGEVADLARRSDFENAIVRLDQLEPLIKQGIAELSKQGDPGQQFKERLQSLLSQIKDLAGTPTGNEAKLMASEAATFAKKSEYESANRILDALVEKLAAAKSQGSGDPAASYNQLRNQLLPLFDQAKQASPQKAEKLTSVWDYAEKQAAGGNFANGLTALQRLETAIKGVLSGAPDPDAQFSVFKLGKLRMELVRLQHSAVSQIEVVAERVQDEFEDEEEIQTAFANAMKRLTDVIESMKAGLADNLDDVLNAEPEKRPQVAGKAKDSISKFLAYLDSDPVLQAMDGNELIPETNVIAPLSQKLQEIVSLLG